MDGDKLAKRLNRVEKKFIEEYSHKKLEQLMEKYMWGKGNDKITFEDSEKAIKELRQELTSNNP